MATRLEREALRDASIHRVGCPGCSACNGLRKAGVSDTSENGMPNILRKLNSLVGFVPPKTESSSSDDQQESSK